MPASKSLAIAPVQETWTPAQRRALRTAGFDAPNPELDLLFHRCQRSGLDPFRGQVYMVTDEYGQWQVRTTIHGLLAGARRAVKAQDESLSISEPQWAGPDGEWVDLWSGDIPPAAARYTVYRAGEPFTGVALFSEYAVFNPETGALNQTWRRRPAGQLAKCAKALALRDACPDELSGIYTDDEGAGFASTGPVDTVAGSVVTAAPTTVIDDLLAEDD